MILRFIKWLIVVLIAAAVVSAIVYFQDPGITA
jgi:hypothetical protein